MHNTCHWHLSIWIHNEHFIIASPQKTISLINFLPQDFFLLSVNLSPLKILQRHIAVFGAFIIIKLPRLNEDGPPNLEVSEAMRRGNWGLFSLRSCTVNEGVNSRVSRASIPSCTVGDRGRIRQREKTELSVMGKQVKNFWQCVDNSRREHATRAHKLANARRLKWTEVGNESKRRKSQRRATVSVPHQRNANAGLSVLWHDLTSPCTAPKHSASGRSRKTRESWDELMRWSEKEKEGHANIKHRGTITHFPVWLSTVSYRLAFAYKVNNLCKSNYLWRWQSFMIYFPN